MPSDPNIPPTAKKNRDAEQGNVVWLKDEGRKKLKALLEDAKKVLKSWTQVQDSGGCKTLDTFYQYLDASGIRAKRNQFYYYSIDKVKQRKTPFFQRDLFCTFVETLYTKLNGEEDYLQLERTNELSNLKKLLYTPNPQEKLDIIKNLLEKDYDDIEVKKLLGIPYDDMLDEEKLIPPHTNEIPVQDLKDIDVIFGDDGFLESDLPQLKIAIREACRYHNIELECCWHWIDDADLQGIKAAVDNYAHQSSASGVSRNLFISTFVEFAISRLVNNDPTRNFSHLENYRNRQLNAARYLEQIFQIFLIIECEFEGSKIVISPQIQCKHRDIEGYLNQVIKSDKIFEAIQILLRVTKKPSIRSVSEEIEQHLKKIFRKWITEIQKICDREKFRSDCILVDLFLPKELLKEKPEQWKIQISDEEERALGEIQGIILRSLDRFNKQSGYHQKFKKRYWPEFQQWMRSIEEDACIKLETRHPEASTLIETRHPEVSTLGQQFWRGKKIAIFTRGLPEDEQICRQVLADLLKSPVVVSLWPLDPEAEFDWEWLFDQKYLGNFGAAAIALKEARCAGEARGNVSFLADCPDRIPRMLQSSPLQMPREA